jgi:DNA-binding MarR family transcriptional regulator
MTAQMRSILVVLNKRGWTPLRPLIRPELGITGPDLSRMVKRGLIEMKQLPDRTVQVRITAYGRALVRGTPCV